MAIVYSPPYHNERMYIVLYGDITFFEIYHQNLQQQKRRQSDTVT